MTEISTPTPAFELKPTTVGRPRLDHYHKILSRFYEPLVLLRLLGQTRGSPRPKPHDLNSIQSTHRAFLRNLSYICDFDRGGDTCTAIGLADHDTFYGFWVASNKGKAEITAFLKTAIRVLHNINKVPETEICQKEAEFMKFCVDFAKKRITKEKNCLTNAVNICQQKLSNTATSEAKKLNEWLTSLLSHDDHLKLCSFAYDSRHSILSQLQRWFIPQEHLLGPENERDSFRTVGHFLGRLAHHIRASKRLVEAAIDLNPILESCQVFAVEHLASVLPPALDRHTNLYGILNRMLGKGHEERLEIEHGLSKINTVNQLFERFPRKYQNLKPQVHAEIQILEQFYQNKIQFANNDRFVACSKAACLCCEMYFKYHPARMIVPESHRNLWTNWGPPIVENFSKLHGAGKQQLQILNNITRDVRNLVISQALEQSSIGNRRPDSTTDITELHSFSDNPTLTNVLERLSMIACKDVLHEQQSQEMEGLTGGPLISPGILTDNIEESDNEDGGVLICT